MSENLEFLPLPSDEDLGRLTKSERELIFDVIQRDKELRFRESTRINSLRAEVSVLQSRSSSSSDVDKVCRLCSDEFGWLFHRGDICPRCKKRVCEKCHQTTIANARYKWLCTLCNKQMELESRSKVWFCLKFRRSGRSVKNEMNKRRFSIEKDSLKMLSSTVHDVKTAEERIDLNRVIYPKDEDKNLLKELMQQKQLFSPTILSSDHKLSPINLKKSTFGVDVLSLEPQREGIGIIDFDASWIGARKSLMREIEQSTGSSMDMILLGDESHHHHLIYDEQQLPKKSLHRGRKNEKLMIEHKTMNNHYHPSKKIFSNESTAKKYYSETSGFDESDGNHNNTASSVCSDESWFESSSCAHIVTSNDDEDSVAGNSCPCDAAAEEKLDEVEMENCWWSKMDHHEDDEATFLHELDYNLNQLVYHEILQIDFEDKKIDLNECFELIVRDNQLLLLNNSHHDLLHRKDEIDSRKGINSSNSCQNNFQIMLNKTDDKNKNLLLLSTAQKKEKKQFEYCRSHYLHNFTNNKTDASNYERATSSGIAYESVKHGDLDSTESMELANNSSSSADLTKQHIGLLLTSKSVNSTNRRPKGISLASKCTAENTFVVKKTKVEEDVKGLSNHERQVEKEVNFSLSGKSKLQSATVIQRDSFSDLVDVEIALMGITSDSEVDLSKNANFNELFLSDDDQDNFISSEKEKREKKLISFNEEIDKLERNRNLEIEEKEMKKLIQEKKRKDEEDLRDGLRKRIILREILRMNDQQPVTTDVKSEDEGERDIIRNLSKVGDNMSDEPAISLLNEHLDESPQERNSDFEHLNETESNVLLVHSVCTTKIIIDEVEISSKSKFNQNSEQHQTTCSPTDGDNDKSCCSAVASTVVTKEQVGNNELNEASKKIFNGTENKDVLGKNLILLDRYILINRKTLEDEEDDLDVQSSDDLEQEDVDRRNESMLKKEYVDSSVDRKPFTAILSTSSVNYKMLLDEDEDWLSTEAKIIEPVDVNYKKVMLHVATSCVVDVKLCSSKVPLPKLGDKRKASDHSSNSDRVLTFFGEPILPTDLRGRHSQDNIRQPSTVIEDDKEIDKDDTENQQTHKLNEEDSEVAITTVAMTNIPKIMTTQNSQDSENIDEESLRKNCSQLAVGSQESILSVYSEMPAVKSHSGKINVVGEIQLSLHYNSYLGSLDVHVHQCKAIAPVDLKRKQSDPYIKTYLLPDKSKSGKQKTSIRPKTLNPIYNEILRYVIPKYDLDKRTLWVSVWHNDRFRHNEFLGDVIITLDDLSSSSSSSSEDIIPRWYTLQQEAGVNWKSVLSLTLRSDLDLAIKYITPERLISKVKGKQKRSYGELIVTVKQAHNLSSNHGNQLSNSFCRCRFLMSEEDSRRIKSQKTRVIKNDSNPKWNHTFVLTGISFEELSNSSLELTIWEYERLNSNEFLTGVQLNCRTTTSKSVSEYMDENADVIAMWKNMLMHPNEWIEGNIELRPYMFDRRT